MQPTVRVLTAEPEDLALGARLVREYAEATVEETAAHGDDTGLDNILPYIPDYHDFPGVYLAGGAAFLVAEAGEVAGCVGVRPLDDGACEMNRLWVRPGHRGRGLGRVLAAASLDEARRLGHRRMVLDVLPFRRHAIDIYRSLGFEDCDPIHEYTFDIVPLARDL